MLRLGFDNTYARLPDSFYARLEPTPVSSPKIIIINEKLAEELNLDLKILRSQEGLAIFSGNRIPNDADPIALVYAGFQFGGWSPQLGDGRAILLGELLGRDHARYDIQLKGSGPTPFSRNGDGRSALGPVLREYIVSEAMHALGISTTRSLAAVATGDQVMRDHLIPGGILTRVASSHLRIGTFQFFAARNEIKSLKALADYAINRHYRELSGQENPYIGLLECVIDKQAALVASWNLVGFIHGVMNTDNVSISGETLDYGPCAFMDDYHPTTVFSSIDHAGRYSYENQAPIAHWNLAAFAQSLLPLISNNVDIARNIAQEKIDSFPEKYESIYYTGLKKKFGFGKNKNKNEDESIMSEFFGILSKNKVDFTLAFRRLSRLSFFDSSGDSLVGDLFDEPQDFDSWAKRWRDRHKFEEISTSERMDQMLSVNPAYIPRNHRIENVIREAEDNNNFEPFHELCNVLGDPYSEHKKFSSYEDKPNSDEIVRATFCGT